MSAKIKKSHLFFVVIVLFVLAAVLGWYAFSEDKGSSVANLPEPQTAENVSTVTTTTYTHFFSVALEAFYSGSNANGVDVPGNKYYPTAADLKNTEWTKNNLQLDTHTIEQIFANKIVYLPVGCDADKPSDATNQCTSFSLKVNGREVATSNN